MQENLSNIFDDYVEKFKLKTLTENKDISINGLKELLEIKLVKNLQSNMINYMVEGKMISEDSFKISKYRIRLCNNNFY